MLRGGRTVLPLNKLHNFRTYLNNLIDLSKLRNKIHKRHCQALNINILFCEYIGNRERIVETRDPVIAKEEPLIDNFINNIGTVQS